MISSFPPIVNHQSKILLLGTMPGEESLRKQEYYGHNSNQFWKIIFLLFGQELTLETNYSAKRELLLNNFIALWDVLSSCKREGSADSAIKEEIVNDFDSLFRKYSQIKYVFFTSKKAEEYYIRYVGKNERMRYFTLPSPSSANARKSLKEKVKDWEIIIEALASS